MSATPNCRMKHFFSPVLAFTPQSLQISYLMGTPLAERKPNDWTSPDLRYVFKPPPVSSPMPCRSLAALYAMHKTTPGCKRTIFAPVLASLLELEQDGLLEAPQAGDIAPSCFAEAVRRVLPRILYTGACTPRSGQ